MVPQSKGDVWPRKTTAALGSAPDDPVSRKNGRIADIVALISLRQAEMADFHGHLWQWSDRDTVPRFRRKGQGSFPTAVRHWGRSVPRCFKRAAIDRNDGDLILTGQITSGQPRPCMLLPKIAGISASSFRGSLKRPS